MLVQLLPSHRTRATLLMAAAGTLVWCPLARGHGEGVLLQRQGNRLVVGFDDDTPGGRSIGQRVFSDLLPSTGLTQDPSFLSVSPAPAGSETLPVGASVFWDFLPITSGEATANLMHWNGIGQTAFSPSTGASLKLYDPNFNSAGVDGSAAAVPGQRIGTTTSSGLALHAHRIWELTATGGSIQPGIYVSSLRLRMPSLLPTPPVYVVLATFGTPTSALDAAVGWLNERVDSLLLAGDYDFNGVIDGADRGVWSQQYGAATPLPVNLGEADGNGDGLIDAADYTVWRDAANPSAPGDAVPEPAGLVAAALAAASAAGRSWRSRKKRTGSAPLLHRAGGMTTR